MTRYLITGAAGSLGRAIVAQLAGLPMERLVAFVRSEIDAAELSAQYRAVMPFKAFIGDIRDEQRLVDAMYGVDLVIHAAALKRVDEGAYNPGEMIATNIVGTQNVVRAATRAGVGRVIVVSSDKAVHPANVYGATKAVAEFWSVHQNAISHPRGTAVSVVRYGNVIGSRGSVFHAWRDQIARGEPLRITKPTMTRFLITLGEAVDFIMRCAIEMEGGEIFVPILNSAFLTDIAAAFAPPSYPFDVADALRPGGEKMHEALLSDEEHGRALYREMDPDIAGGNPVIVVPPHAPSWRSDPYAGIPIVGSGPWVNLGAFWRYHSDDPSFLTMKAADVQKKLTEAGWSQATV